MSKDEQQAKGRAYREKYAEAIKARKKRYAEANKEKMREYHRAYRAAHKDEMNEYKRKYRAANPGVSMQNAQSRIVRLNSARKANLKIKYGVTVETYEQVLQAQGGVCAICGKTNGGKRLVVDHCHATGELRALLCTLCNCGLGYFNDDPALFTRAINYLEACNANPAGSWADRVRHILEMLPKKRRKAVRLEVLGEAA